MGTGMPYLKTFYRACLATLTVFVTSLFGLKYLINDGNKYVLALVDGVVTAILNLDTSVVFLTPILILAARSRGLEVPSLLGNDAPEPPPDALDVPIEELIDHEAPVERETTV